MEKIQTFEAFGASRRSVDRTAGIIRDVKLIGFQSKNRRQYTPESLKAAVSKYEGVKVNVDHPPSSDPSRPRGVADRIGVVRNARFVEGSGIHGDFHFNPKHALAEQIAWDAEHNPSAIGFSHNAQVVMSRKPGVVEAVDRVISVDLVADPATTTGIFEGRADNDAQNEHLTPEEWQRRLTGRGPAQESQQADSWLKRILPGGSGIRFVPRPKTKGR